jgi:hypothetical protein
MTQRSLSANGGTIPLFQNGLQQALGKRKSGVMEIPPTALSVQTMSSKKRRIDNVAHGGTALSSFMSPRDGKINPNLMDSWRAHYINRPGGEEYLPEAERKHNVPHPIGRHVKPLDHNMDPVSNKEFAWLWMKENSALTEENDIFRLSNFGVEQAPLNIINTATLNYALLHQQLADAEKDYEGYLKKQPYEYLTHIRFEGVVETEVTSRGGESSVTSGIDSDASMSTFTGYKLLNIISKGEQSCYNYFGPSIEPGVQCWAIFKKTSSEIPDFRLCPKRNVAGFAGIKAITKVNTHQIKPFMIHFLCTPPGATQVPWDALKYVDELGRERFGQSIFLGSISHVPVDHQHIATDHTSMTPFTDSFSTYNAGQSKIMLPRMIINSNDGIDPFPY